MTFLDTSWTLAEAKATAVSAIISAWIEPNPPVTLLCKIQAILRLQIHKNYWYCIKSNFYLFHYFFWKFNISFGVRSITFRQTYLNKGIKDHVKQIRHLTDVAPDLGLDGWVHLFFIDCHGDQFIQNQGHFLSPVFISLWLAEPVVIEDPRLITVWKLIASGDLEYRVQRYCPTYFYATGIHL